MTTARVGTGDLCNLLMSSILLVRGGRGFRTVKKFRYDDGSEVAERRKNPDNEGIVDAQANVRTV